MATFRNIPFKHLSNNLLLPGTLLPYISKSYINHRYPKYNNFTPMIYKFSTFNGLLQSLDNGATLREKLDMLQVTDAGNSIYFRDISDNASDRIALLRVWFNYTPLYKQLEFISIYELSNSIDNMSMSKYYSTINNNKVYPDFDPANTSVFITNIQNLF